ncbi:hypothetical protein DESC_720352 [Desulfosarcina cetonica]|nr:hypothetical protein DESC_720352 [Desulfosarcina cetonica]
MRQEPVHRIGYKPVLPDAGRQGALHGGNDVFVQLPDVLLDRHQALFVGCSDLLDLAPAGHPAVLCLDAAAIHAGGQLAGVGEVVDPIHPQGDPRGIRRVGQKRRAGTVGKHPAQKIRVKGQIGPPGHIGVRNRRGVEKRGAHERGGELRAHTDRVGAHPRGHVHEGEFHGRHAGDADSGRGDRLHRRQAQLPDDHERMTGKKQIRAGGAAAQALDVGQVEPVVCLDQAAYGGGGQLGIGVGEMPGFAIDGIIALENPVIFKDDPLGPRGKPIHLPQNRLDRVVGHRLAGQEGRQPIDVYTHAAHSFPPWAAAECTCARHASRSAA